MWIFLRKRHCQMFGCNNVRYGWGEAWPCIQGMYKLGIRAKVWDAATLIGVMAAGTPKLI
jgi:hypothetical protein